MSLTTADDATMLPDDDYTYYDPDPLHLPKRIRDHIGVQIWEKVRIEYGDGFVVLRKPPLPEGDGG